MVVTAVIARPLLAVAALLASALVLLAPAVPAARADELVVPAPGARGLASGGGWLTWAEPAPGDRWRLVVRSPGGRVTRPAVRTFAVVPAVSIGSGTSAPGVRRPLLAVFARCAGRSVARDCDVHALDLRAGTEERVERLASPRVSETSPDVVFGRFVVVLRDGPRAGIHTYDPARSPARRLRRLTSFVAPDAAWYGSRVAYTRRVGRRFAVEVRTVAGSRPVGRIASGLRRRPRGFAVQAYRVSWLAGRTALQSARTGPPGRRRFGAVRADRLLPVGTDSVDPRRRTVLHALTRDGLVRLRPVARFGG